MDVDPLSLIKDPYYSATGHSDVRVPAPDDRTSLTLLGIFVDTIEQTRPGPTSNGMEALNRVERFIANGTKFGLSESTPLLPYKSLGNLSPGAQETLFDAYETPSLQHEIARKPVPSTSSPTDEKSIDVVR